MKRFLWMIAAMAVCMGAVPAFAGAVSFESLVGELTNLERLSEMPDPAYVTKQFSSYDRRSKNPSVLTDEDWFANGDRGQHPICACKTFESFWRNYFGRSIFLPQCAALQGSIGLRSDASNVPLCPLLPAVG